MHLPFKIQLIDLTTALQGMRHFSVHLIIYVCNFNYFSAHKKAATPVLHLNYIVRVTKVMMNVKTMPHLLMQAIYHKLMNSGTRLSSV